MPALNLHTYKWQAAFTDVEAAFGPAPATGFFSDGAEALATVAREFRLGEALRVLATHSVAVSFSAPHLPLPGGPPLDHPAWVVLVLGEGPAPAPLPPAWNPFQGLTGGVLLHAVVSAAHAGLLLATVLPVELHRPG